MRNSSLALLGFVFAICTPCLFASDAAEAFASAETKYRHGQYKEALADYQSFQQRFPKDWRVEQAQYTAAFILQKKMKDSAKAVVAYQNLTGPKSSAPISRMAKFHMAEEYVRAGDVQNAIATFEELRNGAGFPRIKAINRALKILRRIASDDPNDQPGWGDKLKGKKWRRLQKLSNEAEGAKTPGF